MKLIILMIVSFSLISFSLFSWTWPISNSSTPDIFISPFGPRDKEDATGLQYDFHKGMDLRALTPLDVHAAHGGVATHFVGNEEGDWIIVENGTTRTYYFHLSDEYVTDNWVWTSVVEGEVIGKSGDTGNVDPHLHFGYLVNTTEERHPLSLNIMPYVNADGIDVTDMSHTQTSLSFIVKVNKNLLDCNEITVNGSYTNDRNIDFTLIMNYNTRYNVPVLDSSNGLIQNVNSGAPYGVFYSIQLTPLSMGSNDQFHEMEVEITQEGTYNPVITGFEVIINDILGEMDHPNSTLTEQNIVQIIDKLDSNHPNPFNPTTTISYSLAENNYDSQIEIYNVKGQKVRSFQLEDKIGKNSIIWDGKDTNDKSVSSGVYFYQLINEGKAVQSRKMLMIK